ncbi:hypothetical protein LguiA_009563 [Lonicera macranthoides]
MTEPSSTTKKLHGKVAIVTGGASGIGEAAARLFADHGALLVIADIQDEKGLRVAQSIGSHRCRFIHCDVADDDQVKEMVNSTLQIYGQVDVMFSNAGTVSTSEQTLLDLNFSEYDRVMAVNARGMASCVKQAARAMVELRVRGSIVCTGSVAASRGVSMRTDYSMSKHAVIGLVRSASRQLGLHGIRVNSVSPLAVPTEFTCKTPAAAEAARRTYEPLTSLKGVELTVGRVADAVLFMASDESQFITGHDLVVDGGLTKLPDPHN